MRTSEWSANDNRQVFCRPTPKPSLLTSSMSAATSSSSIIEQVEPTISDSSASYFGASSYTPQYSLNDAGGLGGGRITTQLGYRKLIESSDYQSLLDNLGRRSSTNIDDAAAATTTPLAEPTTRYEPFCVVNFGLQAAKMSIFQQQPNLVAAIADTIRLA